MAILRVSERGGGRRITRRGRGRAVLVLAISIAWVGCGGDGDGKAGDASVGDGAPGDAGIDTPGATADASIGPVCGATTCGMNEVCCTGSTIRCVATGECPTQNFACDGAEDCAGGICCFGNQGAGGSVCRTAGSNCQEVACHADAECPTATPKCCPKLFTPSYGVCLAACP